MPSKTYLERALAKAKAKLDHADWVAISRAARGAAGGTCAAKQENPEYLSEEQLAEATANYSDDLLQRSASAILQELTVRGLTPKAHTVKCFSPRPLSEAQTAVFLNAYAPLLKDADATSDLDSLHGHTIVALGKEAETTLADAGLTPAATIAHPASFIRSPHRIETIEKKLAQLQKRLDTEHTSVVQSPQSQPTQASEPLKTYTVDICKADAEKRIVYGVVLDPYIVDAHNDWIPVQHVEETAHNWFQKSRVIGIEHSERANAFPVESWLVHYPTGEYSKAVRGKAHRAYKMAFGGDVVHSGAWIVGTKLGDREWEMFKKGEINAYSIGAYGIRTEIRPDTRPEVEFITLTEKD